MLSLNGFTRDGVFFVWALRVLLVWVNCRMCILVNDAVPDTTVTESSGKFFFLIILVNCLSSHFCFYFKQLRGSFYSLLSWGKSFMSIQQVKYYTVYVQYVQIDMAITKAFFFILLMHFLYIYKRNEISQTYRWK